MSSFPPFLSRNVIYPLQEALLSRPTFRYLKQLEQTQWLTRDDTEALQVTKLRTLLSSALRHCPWHAERIKAADIIPERCTLEDFRRLPTMSKQDAQLHGAEMRWRDVPGGSKQYSTGGSSGQPLIFHFGRWRQASDAAGRIRARRWWGVNVGDPEVYLWGAPVELNKTDKIKTVRDRLLNQLVLNAFAMSPENMDRYLESIKKFNPKCIYGYASSIAILAKHAQTYSIETNFPELKVICTTGEPLYPDQRKLIQETFHAPVANEFGSRDIGFTAHETPHGQMLQMSESIILEVLDRHGNPVKAGEMGEAVMTGLCSEAQPFIRYRTGDMIKLSEQPDKDGRGLHVIEEVVGRTTDFLIHQNGSIVHALAAIYVLRETEGVEQFKIIQHDINQFEVLIVKNTLWHDIAFQHIEQKFKERFGNAANIDIRLIDRIEPEASGKIRQVVAKIQPNL
ncbi:phenylacetate--CoA ligase family protein [Methylomarinum vadi]|uniref:phenylacetate--CoA ligase family protein n=1 Tax=Methylomarinum vadi TaxID=438855 RepID=UPI0004DF2B3F|nr:phenylacetate--CoA ligase family protein [Methylomarinum vadi]